MVVNLWGLDAIFVNCLVGGVLSFGVIGKVDLREVILEGVKSGKCENGSAIEMV